MAARWLHWKNVNRCEVWQACALTMDIDPRVFTVSSQTGAILPRQPGLVSADDQFLFGERVLAAISHLGDGLRIVGPHKYRRRYQISLAQFGAWAPRDWNLPDQFPGRRRPIKPQQVPPEPKPTPTRADQGGIAIKLPHTTKALEAIFKIIRDHWTSYGAENPPKQTAIAKAIDEAMGWTRADGKPSRSGETLAGLIRPDGLAEKDKRTGRGKTRR